MASTTVLGLTLSVTPPVLTALRLAPLIGATGSITHAYCEWLMTTSFLSTPPTSSGLTRSMVKSEYSNAPPVNGAEVEAAKDVVIPVWFVNFFSTGVKSVVGLNSITTLSALANLFLFPDGLGAYNKFYVAGLAAAVAHFAFVPGVAGSVERLFKLCVRQAKGEGVNEEEKGVAASSVKEWVGVHKIRMSTVDIIAWVCFAVGVVGVLTP